MIRVITQLTLAISQQVSEWDSLVTLSQQSLWHNKSTTIQQNSYMSAPQKIVAISKMTEAIIANALLLQRNQCACSYLGHLPNATQKQLLLLVSIMKSLLAKSQWLLCLKSLT